MTPKTVNEESLALFRAARPREAADLVLSLPPGDYVGCPHQDLWWHHCEDLADALADRPADAIRLYEMAHASWQKEGSVATGAGEGLMAVRHIEEILEKIERLRRAR
jgi:hypothetical protein